MSTIKTKVVPFQVPVCIASSFVNGNLASQLMAVLDYKH